MSGRVGGYPKEHGRHTMPRQTQGQARYGAGAAYGATDWQALEVQLNRTRNILQEILVHLQEVLRNLKMARPGGAGAAESGRSGGHESSWRRPHASTRAHQGAGAAQSGASQAGAYASGKNGGAAGASDRFRSWNRPGHDARTGAGASQRTTTTNAGSRTDRDANSSRTRTGTGEKTRPGEGWSFRSQAGASRSGGNGTAGGQTFRERFRAENTSRTAGTAGAGASRDRTERTERAASGTTTSSTFARARQAGASRPSGFRMDHERQSRAREIARRGGMNLKCAYDILCLDYPCSVDEIKVAYRHMARLYHPDLGGDEEAMKDVNVAYELAMRFCAGPRRTSTAWAV